MPTFDELDQINRHPEPAYPDYPALREQAERVFGPFVSPQEIAEGDQVLRTRSDDWAAAVLGKPFPGSLQAISTTDARMLILAHRQDLDPPLPERLLRWRREDAQRREQDEARRRDAQRRLQQRWDEVRVQCAIPVEVRLNARGGRRTRGYGSSGHLGHVVPLTDARSPRRRHQAGRALCETSRRSTPLVLTDPVDEPATCHRCLDFARTAQPASGPGEIRSDATEAE